MSDKFPPRPMTLEEQYLTTVADLAAARSLQAIHANVAAVMRKHTARATVEESATNNRVRDLERAATRLNRERLAHDINLTPRQVSQLEENTNSGLGLR